MQNLYENKDFYLSAFLMASGLDLVKQSRVGAITIFRFEKKIVSESGRSILCHERVGNTDEIWYIHQKSEEHFIHALSEANCLTISTNIEFILYGGLFFVGLNKFPQINLLNS